MCNPLLHDLLYFGLQKIDSRSISLSCTNSQYLIMLLPLLSKSVNLVTLSLLSQKTVLYPTLCIKHSMRIFKLIFKVEVLKLFIYKCSSTINNISFATIQGKRFRLSLTFYIFYRLLIGCMSIFMVRVILKFLDYIATVVLYAHQF